MTRVLQIRRGTSAQHENFVGLPGEITMDTDNKTIRLHDGETLGGITVGNGGNGNTEFDINSVPDDFGQILSHSMHQNNSKLLKQNSLHLQMVLLLWNILLGAMMCHSLFKPYWYVKMMKRDILPVTKCGAGGLEIGQTQVQHQYMVAQVCVLK